MMDELTYQAKGALASVAAALYRHAMYQFQVILRHHVSQLRILYVALNASKLLLANLALLSFYQV